MPYIIALVVIVALGVGFTLIQSPKTATTDSTPTITEETNETADSAEVATTEVPHDYDNGVHRTEVTYMTPLKNEYRLDVSLTLNNDIVTDADITYSQGAEIDPNAQKFEGAYKTEIIGKDIDSLNLSRVGGASLTTGAFNEALATIKTDAKS